METNEKTTELDDSVAPFGEEEQTVLMTPKRRTTVEGECVICDGHAKVGTILCKPCKSKLVRPKSFCPEQIWSDSLEVSQPTSQESAGSQPGQNLDPNESHALLIDPYGRPHLLSTTGGRTTTTHSVGRLRQCRIAIAEPHVSRLHAHLEYREHSGAWFVRNESRRNQTRIHRRFVQHYPVPVDSGHQITFGTVGFYFRDLGPEELGWATEALATAGGRGSDPIMSSFPTQESARAVLLTITEESWGGTATARSRAGGTVEVRLTELEVRFMKLLLDRREAQNDRLARERGFVSSAEILSSALPFDSSYPDKDNLKALVRRLRRRFSSHNAHDVIESRQGFGYRIHPDAEP